MTDAEDFLAHFASKYYDPVKAREYYLRNRKLKGKALAKAEKEVVSSDAKKAQGVAYVKNVISTKKTNELNELSKSTSAKLEDLQKKAEQSRDELLKKFTDFVESLKNKREDKLNKIPADASPRLRAFLEKQNQRINASINKESAQALKNHRDSVAAVGNNLKNAVSDARSSYAEARKKLADKYNLDLKTEITNITNKVK